MSLITNAERLDDTEIAIRTAVQGEFKKMWTAMPAVVQQASDGHTATLQPAVNGVQVQVDGSTQNKALPQHIDAPVHFPGGGGVSHTHPVQPGDEGVALILSRAQDTWHQQGGTNNDPIDDRMFDLSDARWLPGGRSDPRKLNPPASTSSSQARSDDGNHVMDLHPGSGITHASIAKAMTIVGGASGAGTMHTPGSIFKNAARVLVNCAQAAGLPPPGLTMANNMAVAVQPPPAAGPMASTISSLMSSVLSGGPAAVLSDPTAAVNAALSGAASSGAAALTSALGGAAAPLVSAMTGAGGLSASLSSLAAGTAALSGIATPASGAFGLSDILSHATAVTQYFGSTPPTSVAMSAVLGPLQSAPTMAAMQTQMSSLVSSVIGGSMSVSAATAAVSGMTSTLSALMPAANSAISTMQAALPSLSLVASAGAAGISQNPAMQAVASVIGNGPLGSLTSAMSAMVTPTAGELAAAVAFPDLSAIAKGATGGL